MNSVALIVPNWNGINEIEACLRSLEALEPAVTVIVVDNGSTDGSRQLIEKDFPGIVLLPQPKNLGFAGGVNVGIWYALGRDFDYIGLFNSDAVADRNWARMLVETLEANPQAGIATGLLLHGDGKTIDSTGDWYTTWGLPYPRGRGELAAKAQPGGLVFGASGGASIYRAELLRTIGLFDEAFFAYYEDVDISFRAQLAGYTVVYEPKAIVYHEQGAASSRIGATAATLTTKVSGFTVYQTFKNLPLLFVKNVPLGLLPTVSPRFNLAYVLIFGNAVRNGHGWPAVKGVARYATLIPHAFRERRRIQRSKTVSTEYIRSILWPDLPPIQTGLRKFRHFFTGK